MMCVKGRIKHRVGWCMRLDRATGRKESRKLLNDLDDL